MPIEKAPELYNLIDGLKMMFKMFPCLGFTRKWGRISTQDFAGHFKNPFLREAFSVAFAADILDMPMIAMLMTLAWLHQKTAGYPLRGTLKFARAIERGYLDMGDKIHYKSRVIKILVENDKAKGVQPATALNIAAISSYLPPMVTALYLTCWRGSISTTKLRATKTTFLFFLPKD